MAIYYALDGNDVGKKLDRLIAEGTDEELIEFSNTVHQHVQMVSHLLKGKGARIIFATGDGILARSDRDLSLDDIPLRCCGVQFSLGIGNSALEASLALKIAKTKSDPTSTRFPWRS